MEAGRAIAEKDSEALEIARRGLDLFRERVQQIEKLCEFTRVTRTEHTRASQCSPWRDSTNEGRLDGEDGLLLTLSIDHLFDRGFISFAAGGRALVLPDVTSPRRAGWACPWARTATSVFAGRQSGFPSITAITSPAAGGRSRTLGSETGSRTKGSGGMARPSCWLVRVAGLIEDRHQLDAPSCSRVDVESEDEFPSVATEPRERVAELVCGHVRHGLSMDREADRHVLPFRDRSAFGIPTRSCRHGETRRSVEAGEWVVCPRPHRFRPPGTRSAIRLGCDGAPGQIRTAGLRFRNGVGRGAFRGQARSGADTCGHLGAERGLARTGTVQRGPRRRHQSGTSSRGVRSRIARSASAPQPARAPTPSTPTRSSATRRSFTSTCV